MDNEIIEEKLTKIMDISFSDNRALAIIQRNAIMSKRSNQLKSQYFELDLTVGKLLLTNHPNFSQEERLMNELKKLLKEYKVLFNQKLMEYVLVCILVCIRSSKNFFQNFTCNLFILV